jgi:hypothetical protein
MACFVINALEIDGSDEGLEDLLLRIQSGTGLDSELACVLISEVLRVAPLPETPAGRARRDRLVRLLASNRFPVMDWGPPGLRSE